MKRPSQMRVRTHNDCQKRSRKAFTFVELLVVIALIIIIAGILLATIGKSRNGSGTSNRIKCAANLKQIGLAIQLYCNENKGAYPRTGYTIGGTLNFSNDTTDGGTARDPFGEKGLPGKVADNDVTAAIFLLIRTQDITAMTFICPTSDADYDTFGNAPGATAMNKTSFTDWHKNLSYSYINPYPDAAAIKGEYKVNATVGANIAIAADMNPGIGDGYDVTLPTMNSPTSDMKKANSRNHQGEGQNVLYGDGHAEWQENAFSGMKRDNIYTVSGSTDGTTTTSKTVIGSPKWSGDSVLLPAYK